MLGDPMSFELGQPAALQAVSTIRPGPGEIPSEVPAGEGPGLGDPTPSHTPPVQSLGFPKGPALSSWGHRGAPGAVAGSGIAGSRCLKTEPLGVAGGRVLRGGGISREGQAPLLPVPRAPWLLHAPRAGWHRGHFREGGGDILQRC